MEKIKSWIVKELDRKLEYSRKITTDSFIITLNIIDKT